MIINQINEFINSEDNDLNFKIMDRSRDSITISICEYQEFTIVFGDNFSVSVKSDDEQLQKHFVAPMNEYCAKNGRVDMRSFLVKCTEVYASIPDDEDEMQDEETGCDSESDDQYFYNDEEQFDDVLMSPTSEAKLQEKRERMADALHKMVQETDKKQEISKTIQQMKGTAMKDYSKEADKVMKVVFYTDGFVVEDGPLMQMNDPNNKGILDSFKAGFVPEPYAGGAKDVDVHVLWEDCTFAEKQSREIAKKEDEINDVEELYIQQQLAQFAEMEGNTQKDTETTMQHETNVSVNTTETTFNPPNMTTTNTSEAHVLQDDVQQSVGVFIKEKTPFVQSFLVESKQTTIKFRIGGDSLVHNFNLDDKVKDIAHFLSQHSNCPDKFKLLVLYPRREIVNPNETIEAAKLQNAGIQVHPV